MGDPGVPTSSSSPGHAQAARRLGRNLNGYCGETIEIASVLGDCASAAHAHGWAVEELDAGPSPGLLAFTRAVTDCERRIYLSSGIHGDEPAGPLAVRHLLQENKWPPKVDLRLCPCLNPTGFTRNQRENSEGADLNRQYLRPTAPETLAHIAWLQRQPRFDLCLCLHEDWEADGFYLYELNPDNQPSLAEKLIARVAQVCPIDLAEAIEGWPAGQGIIRPNVDLRSRPQWAEAFWLLTNKTRLSYTVEAPSDFPLATRIAALVAAVHAALEPN